MFYIQAIFLCLFVTLCSADTFSRKLEVRYNPGCDSCNNRHPPVHLVYSRGVSNIDPTDVLLTVTSGGGALGPVSQLLIRAAGAESALHFNWSILLSNDSMDYNDGITLTGGTPVFKAAYIITRLWEFNDTDHSANMTAAPLVDSKNVSLWRKWTIDNLVWNVNAADVEKSHAVEFTSNQTTVKEEETEENDFEEAMDISDMDNLTTILPTTPKPTKSPSRKPSLFKESGSSLKFRFVLSGNQDRSDILPRLAFSSNNTQMDVVMDNLNISHVGSRFAITVVQIISQQNSDMEVDMHQTVDDEFTPGIFKMYNWNARPKKMTTEFDRGYLQWKPVCYTSSDRHLKGSQQMSYYPSPSQFDPADKDIIRRAAIYPIMKDNYHALPMNISFGEEGGDFYLKTNYTSWTASMGLGEPPSDEVSLLVILIITCGLGLPVLLIFAGSIYICVRRRRVPVQSYEAIN